MKKRLLAIVLLFCVLCFVGCGKKTEEIVIENMSELTKDFFFGENEKCYATLSVGTREKDYLMDGKSTPKTDFSLFCITFFEENVKNMIVVEVSVNGQKKMYDMEFNSFSNAYMVDLEKKILPDDEIAFAYEGESVSLANLSKNFGVNWKEAISIACKNFEKAIDGEIKHGVCSAEFYLKILDKRANNFDDFFWCFTILNDKNESKSIIISTTDGSVLAKSN